MSELLATAVRERAAGTSSLTPQQVAQLRTSMQLSRAASFQPDVVQDFTLRSLATLRGVIEQRGKVWQVRHVPESVRSAFGSSVSSRYDAITFERTEGPVPGPFAAELVAPGHPLLGALVSAIETAAGQALQQGVVLEDDRTDEDYTLVTLAAGDTDRGTGILQTFAVAASGGLRPVDPALYTSLTAAAATASDSDVAAARQAVDLVSGPAVVWNVETKPGEAAAELLAVAYVRGTAEPADAAAWKAARASLFGQLTAQFGPGRVAEALPGAGWDFMTSNGETSFYAAAPASCPGTLRRAETIVSGNLGPAYARREI